MLIKSCRCSQLECNEDSGETEVYFALYTQLLSLSGHSKIDKTRILMINGSLIKVEILQHFCHALSDNWSCKPFLVFLRSHFRQGVLYSYNRINCNKAQSTLSSQMDLPTHKRRTSPFLRFRVVLVVIIIYSKF